MRKFNANSLLAIIWCVLSSTSVFAQSTGTIIPNTNMALPESYNFQEYVFAEPEDSNECTGVANSSAEIIDIFFSQMHRHRPDDAFFFLIGHRPALLQVAVEGTGERPDISVEGFLGGVSQGVLCFTKPDAILQDLNTEIPDFSSYYNVTLPKSWMRQNLTLSIKMGTNEKSFSSAELKVGPYTEMNLVEVKMDVMDYNGEPHKSPKFQRFLEEVASAIPASVVRFGEFPETLVYPELIASNDTEQLVRLKSRGEMPANGISSDGSINSVAVLALNNLHHATGDFLSTVYFGNTLNLDPGGWGGGNSFVGPDFTDVFIHELGHAMSLLHWGQGPFGNPNSSKYDFLYPYGGAENDGGGRGDAWTFNQDLYEFVDPTCQYDGRGTAGIESSDAMQRNNFCLEKRSDGPGPWDGFGDFSSYAMHQYLIGDPNIKTGKVRYKGDDVDYQFRFQEGFPVVSLVNGKREYVRISPQIEENLHVEEVLDLPGEETLNAPAYLIYGTIHESQDQANIVYKPIEFVGTVPPLVDPTDPATFDALKGDEFARLGQRDITIKLSFTDGTVKHALNTYHSIARAPYTDGYGIFRFDLSNFSLVVPRDKKLAKVEVFIRPFASFGIGNPHIGNINDAAQGITAENFMEAADWKSEYVYGGPKPVGPNGIGNRVWNDENQNGIDDFGEPGIAGVKLIMWADSNGDDVPDSEGFRGVAITDSTGHYRFSPGAPGKYVIFVWSVDNWEEDGPLFGMKSVEGFVDPNTDINGDDNGRPGGFPGLGNLDFSSGIIDISTDGEPLNDGDVEDEWFDLDRAGNMTIDFGFYFTSECPKLNIDFGATELLCQGDLTEINLTPADGQGPFAYEWADGGSGATLENVGPGTYKVTFTDGEGCSGMDSITIQELDEIQIEINVPDSLCTDEITDLKFVVSGGLPPYVLTLEGGDFGDVGPGIYKIVITDENGCSAEQEFEIFTASEVSCISNTYELEVPTIDIRPNPFSSEVRIINHNQEVLSCRLINLQGKIFYFGKLEIGENAILLDAVQSGIYFAIISDKEGAIIGRKKLIKLD